MAFMSLGEGLVLDLLLGAWSYWASHLAFLDVSPQVCRGQATQREGYFHSTIQRLQKLLCCVCVAGLWL